jgi:hypothetical protein
LATTAAAFAQLETDTLSPLQASAMCGPPASAVNPPPDVLRIRGSQDTAARGMYSQRDLLVIGGGTNAGIQLGQQFFVRRGIRWGLPTGVAPHGVSTVAWIRVVAVNDTTAIATVVHACDAILLNDYLEPFVMPVVPAGVDRDDATGELDFTSLARVMVGAENRFNGATGDLMLMDRGSDQGVAPGTRFAVFRDLRRTGMPLAAIGEAVVLTTSGATSVVRLTRIRDAVQPGDYLVQRK